MLEQLLPALSRALGTRSLSVELTEHRTCRVAVAGEAAERPRSVLAGHRRCATADDWTEVDWTLPLDGAGPHARAS